MTTITDQELNSLINGAGVPTFELIDADDIVVDAEVQRLEGLSATRVKQIASRFDASALGTLSVSRRPNGKCIIFDGMHREAAARAAGFKGPFPAMVHTGLSKRRERELFILHNDTKNVSAVTLFVQRAAIGEGGPALLNKMLNQYGWTVKPGNSDGYFNAVGALESVFNDGARTLPPGAYPDVAEWVISVITSAWGHNPRGVNQNIIRGLGKFRGRYGDEIQNKKVLTELKQLSPLVLLGRARSMTEINGGTVPTALAQVVLGLHNNRLRTSGLDEWGARR